MPFDPFKDFEKSGYLRNLLGSQDMEVIRDLENIQFQTNLRPALNQLQAVFSLDYKHVLMTHKTLFGDLYPLWAGKDRRMTSPHLNISKNGYERMFCDSNDIEKVVRQALKQGQDYDYMQAHPSEIMGLLAHAHPFLDGNGRTIMLIHADLCDRAEISIDWEKINKQDYLKVLTKEIYLPGQGHLDNYLRPFIGEAKGISIGNLGNLLDRKPFG